MTTFSDVLEAADDLSLEEQETLIEVLQRRIAQRNRDALVRDVTSARAEFEKGTSRSVSVRELMDEVRGES